MEARATRPTDPSILHALITRIENVPCAARFGANSPGLQGVHTDPLPVAEGLGVQCQLDGHGFVAGTIDELATGGHALPGEEAASARVYCHPEGT